MSGPALASAIFVGIAVFFMALAIAAVFLLALILLDAFDSVEDAPDQRADGGRLGPVDHNFHIRGDNDA